MKIIFIILLSIITSTFIVSASVNIQNVSVVSVYSPKDNIRGEINFSIGNEDATTKIWAFESNTSLLDFLKNNSLIAGKDFSCSPLDCNPDYDGANPSTIKSYSLGFGENKIIGLKISGIINSIDSFSMDIESTAGESTYPQLYVDFLNDGKIEWKSNNFSGIYGGAVYGCYNPGETQKIAEITQIEYCERVNLSQFPKVTVGADIIETSGGGGSASFYFRIYNDKYDGSCIAKASKAGTVSCEVDIISQSKQDFFVCISSNSYEDEKKYSINYEEKEPCGFSENELDFIYDFPIFARPGTFAPIKNLTISQSEIEKLGSNVNLEGEIGDYIEKRYNNNCTEGCLIPIKIISGEKQNLSILNSKLSYTTGISTTERNLYDITEKTGKLNMDFRTLDLEKANLRVPDSLGKKTLSLKIGGQEILSKEIEIVRLAQILGLFPTRVPAAISTKFFVEVSGINITQYSWDFGDGTQTVSEENYTYHTYNSTGSYNLKISVNSSEGESTKTFNILARSPIEEINSTLAEKKIELSQLKSQLNKITEWYKSYLNEKIDSAKIESEINSLEKEYLTASSSDYVGIIEGLNSIKIPKSIYKEESSGEFIPDPETIDESYLIDLGEEEGSEIPERIAYWFVQNVLVTVNMGTIYLNYSDQRVPAISYYKVKISPLDEIGKSYFVIAKDINETKFKQDYGQKEAGSGTAIEFSEINEGGEIIEFVLENEIEIASLPIYVSPEFSKLPAAIVAGPCDNDGICEEEENEENCINDCHKLNTGRLFLWLFLLFLAAFIVYIILQEWYKRYYEGYLFKNKNDLYNLMNFMYNALKTNVDKNSMLDKLRQYHWSREQISYAFKKLYGKRTGMWEIPLFRFFEKKRVREEMAKRNVVNPPYQSIQKI